MFAKTFDTKFGQVLFLKCKNVDRPIESHIKYYLEADYGMFGRLCTLTYAPFDKIDEVFEKLSQKEADDYAAYYRS